MAVTVAELIEYLQEMDPQAEVRLAIQPTYPMEHSVNVSNPVVEVGNVVYIAEGAQVDYLSGEASSAIGW